VVFGPLQRNPVDGLDSATALDTGMQRQDKAYVTIVVCKVANCVANAKIDHSYLAVMWSRDFVSVSRIVSRPNFASLDLQGFRSRLGLEGYRSRSQAYCLETLNIASIWLSKTNSTKFFSIVFAGEKQ